MPKSLLDRIKAKPPAEPISMRWWDKLGKENPTLKRELDVAVDAFWRGELSAQCPRLMNMVRELQEFTNKGESAVKDFINSRKPKANG